MLSTVTTGKMSILFPSLSTSLYGSQCTGDGSSRPHPLRYQTGNDEFLTEYTDLWNLEVKQTEK